MYAIEFRTNVKDGVISIPEKYRSKLQENVTVIVMKEDKELSNNMIDELLDSPRKIAGFKPLTKADLYEHLAKYPLFIPKKFKISEDKQGSRFKITNPFKIEYRPNCWV